MRKGNGGSEERAKLQLKPGERGQRKTKEGSEKGGPEQTASHCLSLFLVGKKASSSHINKHTHTHTHVLYLSDAEECLYVG